MRSQNWFRPASEKPTKLRTVSRVPPSRSSRLLLFGVLHRQLDPGALTQLLRASRPGNTPRHLCPDPSDRPVVR